MVEKPDFAHTRARVRNPLDKVLRKCTVCVFAVLAHSGEAQGGGSCRVGLIREGEPHVRWGRRRMAGTSDRTRAHACTTPLDGVWSLAEPAQRGGLVTRI
jgi:hypothetical protein